MIQKRFLFGTLFVCVAMLLFTARVVFAAESSGFGSEVNHRDATDTGANSPDKVEEGSVSDSASAVAADKTRDVEKANESAPALGKENSSTSVTAEITPPKNKKYDVAFTAAVAIPQPLTIGVQAHRVDSPYLDAFYEAGFFKYPLTSSTRSGSDYSFVAGVRYHPFQNWFYTSAELGFRHIGVSVDISNLKQDGVALANTATMSIGTFFLGLLVGGEWKLTQSLSMAVDMGVQFALLHTGGIAIHADPSQDDGTDLTVDDNKEMARISGLPLPQIALFRFVWYI